MKKNNNFLQSILRNIRIITGISFILSFSLVNAQQTILTTGGDITGVGGSISYSVGQIDYITNIGNSGSECQGVQQPYEIYSYSSVEYSGISLGLSTYPNPTNDYIFLTVDLTSILDISTLHYQLFDMKSSLIEDQPLPGNTTIINTSQLVPATYIIKVLQNTTEVQTFKIVKN